MSSCGMQTFNNVNQGIWQCLCSKAAQYGVTISGDSGSASSHGFTVTWNYDPGAQTLQLQVTDKPWWAPCSTVNSKVHDEIDSCYSDHSLSVTPMLEES